MQTVSLDLARRVPAVFGTQPREGLSHKYAFINTASVLERLQAAGWQVSDACQVRTHAENRLIGRHSIRLRHPDMLQHEAKGDLVPEFVLLNSHDGSSAYQLHMGLFRMVCANGLVIADSVTKHINVRHSDKAAEQVVDASFRLVNETPKVIDLASQMQAISLTPGERELFASAASMARWGEKAPIRPAQLLEYRRYGDKEPDLWTTFNVVQENLFRAGLVGKSTSGRATRTRAVTSPAISVPLNKALWQLADEMRKLKVSA